MTIISVVKKCSYIPIAIAIATTRILMQTNYRITARKFDIIHNASLLTDQSQPTQCNESFV